QAVADRGDRQDTLVSRRVRQGCLPSCTDRCRGIRDAKIMGQKIERDYQRFRKIVRGKVKSNLSKYISRGEMIGKKGNDLVSIPLPQIEIPQFRFGTKGSGGVGQGEGDPGTPLTAPEGDGDSSAGDQPCGQIREVELT